MVTFTGLGSLPGTDFAQALRMTLELAEDFPYLPELPARGPWAAMLGRTLGLPAALPVSLEAGEWRLSDTAGVDQRRARATWRDDLDQLTEIADGFTGRLKVAVAGPWTLAAALAYRGAGRVLADPGARRDLAQSLAVGVQELFADLHRRLPGTELVLQIDEPALPMVAAGGVPTPGGYFRHPAIGLPELVTALGWLTGPTGAGNLVAASVLHSCAPWASGPWPLQHLVGPGSAAGFTGISLDLDQLTTADHEVLAQAVQDQATIHLGCLPTTAERPISVDLARERVLRMLHRIGGMAADQLVLTPACGLAGWTPSQAAAALRVLARVSEQITAELAG